MNELSLCPVLWSKRCFDKVQQTISCYCVSLVAGPIDDLERLKERWTPHIQKSMRQPE